ncbi:hypothetical protein Pmar_PMAR020077, partial [Perkinsus marinus ATCC 50983]
TILRDDPEILLDGADPAKVVVKYFDTLSSAEVNASETCAICLENLDATEA